MSLKTVAEHNRQRRETWGHRYKSPSGVACPECGKEMLVDTAVSLTSDPPQNPAHCPHCGYKTNLVA